MDVLQDQWKFCFAAIAVSWLADRACRRIKKKCTVIRFAVVIARGAKSQRPAQNQYRRRKRPPVMLGINQRRIKRREVRSPFVEMALERTERRINRKQPQANRHCQRLNPPEIAPLRCAEAIRELHGSRFRHRATAFRRAILVSGQRQVNAVRGHLADRPKSA